MEILLRAMCSGYANERWVPAPEIHASPRPAPLNPASSPLFPGPWLHVFSLTLRVWFLLNKAFLGG